MSTSGLISFNDALGRAGEEDPWTHAKTVQVILGSADADSLHWGHGENLYYAIEWGGVCVGLEGAYGQPSTHSCAAKTWGTVIDAHTGAFIVSGA